MSLKDQLRVHNDPMGGVSAAWVIQYYDSEMELWFDYGDGVPTQAKAQELMVEIKTEENA